MEKEYKIGDKGQAGGIVFHFWYEGRWTRYAEVAPANMEFTSVWGPVNIAVAGTSQLGSQNTEEIIKASGAKDNAAKRCANLVSYNGVRDWFLPSKEELALMYENLHYKRLGNFKKDLYWSSTIDTSDVNHSYTARLQSFITGKIDSVYRLNVFCVRAIRYFS